MWFLTHAITLISNTKRTSAIVVIGIVQAKNTYKWLFHNQCVDVLSGDGDRTKKFMPKNP